MKNKKYLLFIQFALLVIVILLVVFSIRFVQQTINENSAASENTALSSEPTMAEAFVLANEKLPVDWVTEIDEAGRLLLSNSATGCFVDLLYTTDTTESNSPDINQNQQTIDAIEAKGYQVNEAFETLTIMTDGGKKTLEAQKLTITGLDNPLFQKYVYMPTNESFTKIQLSCPSNDNLADAESALLSVEFTTI